MTYDELLTELSWQPKIEGDRPNPRAKILLGGMGGSALPANATRFLDATIPIESHRDYDLPEDATSDTLYVAMSYSGNTAETLSFAHEVYERGFALGLITSGGELATFARDKGVPLIEVPAGMQPRNALMYQLRALLAMTGYETLLEALASVSFDNEAAENVARSLAEGLADTFPLFYASRRNGFLAYVSKIHLNETGKMPAAANVFPELNHNEMQSWDTAAPEPIAKLGRFVLWRDEGDDERVRRRMDVFEEVLRERGREIYNVSVARGSRAEQLAAGWYVGHCLARNLAQARSVDPDAVPLVEDFKGRL